MCIKCSTFVVDFVRYSCQNTIKTQNFRLTNNKTQKHNEKDFHISRCRSGKR